MRGTLNGVRKRDTRGHKTNGHNELGRKDKVQRQLESSFKGRMANPRLYVSIW